MFILEKVILKNGKQFLFHEKGMSRPHWSLTNHFLNYEMQNQ